MTIIVRRPWTRQPQAANTLNGRWASSIGFVSSSSGLEKRDIKTGAFATSTGTILQTISGAGKASYANSVTNTRLSWDLTTISSYNNGYAMLVVASPLSDSLVGRAFVIGDEAASNYTSATFAFNADQDAGLSNGRFALSEYSSGYKARGNSVNTAVEGNPHTYLVNRPAGSAVGPSFYVDGIDRTETSTASAGVAATVGVHTHGAPVSTSAGYRWPMSLAVVFNRPLSVAECLELSRNPWQIFAPRQNIIPTTVAAATAPTLSALSAINVTATSAQPRMTYTF